MKNINYILRDEQDRAAGNAGSRVRRRGRPSGEDKVVDLMAWKAENLAADWPKAGRESSLGQYGAREPVRRRRRRSAAAQNRAELAATLAVTAAFVALILRVLLF